MVCWRAQNLVVGCFDNCVADLVCLGWPVVSLGGS